VVFGQRDKQSVRQSKRYDRNVHRSKLHCLCDYWNPDAALCIPA
jgi:hypothetical protein